MRRAGSRRASRTSSQRSNATLGHAVSSTTNYYATAASSGVRGSATGFWATWLGVINAAATNNHLFNCSNATEGWQINLNAPTNLWFLVADGTVAFRGTPNYNPAALIGKISHITGVHTGAGNTIRLYINGVEIGSGSACTGYTVPAGATLNRVAGLNAACDSVFMGGMGGLGVPSAAQILANAQACRAARRLVAMAGVAPDHMWVPLATVASIADSIGSDTMTKNGGPVLTYKSDWSY